MITYEYPLTERFRTLLRIENLFDKVMHFAQSDNSTDHHVALVILFEILEVIGRADLKFELVQELERQRQTLLSFQKNPNVSEEILSGALYEIEQASTILLAMQGKVGQHLRDNEWLTSIRNRASLPGGVCEFDLPSYHFWLNLDPELRQKDLEGWIAPMLPVRQGASIVMRFLRSSGRPEKQCAPNGAFQMMLTGRSVQMVRLNLKRSDVVVPEISANKYALNIRFSTPGTTLKPKQVETDVNFDLTFCNL
ncbi:MAG: cell division protein ZapD [Rhodocyclaceae bacterium]|nr:cell division protein ZapD [Rhodocyclaceae bacterium]